MLTINCTRHGCTSTYNCQNKLKPFIQEKKIEHKKPYLRAYKMNILQIMNKIINSILHKKNTDSDILTSESAPLSAPGHLNVTYS